MSGLVGWGGSGCAGVDVLVDSFGEGVEGCFKGCDVLVGEGGCLSEEGETEESVEFGLESEQEQLRGGGCGVEGAECELGGFVHEQVDADDVVRGGRVDGRGTREGIGSSRTTHGHVCRTEGLEGGFRVSW